MVAFTLTPSARAKESATVSQAPAPASMVLLGWDAGALSAPTTALGTVFAVETLMQTRTTKSLTHLTTFSKLNFGIRRKPCAVPAIVATREQIVPFAFAHMGRRIDNLL